MSNVISIHSPQQERSFTTKNPATGEELHRYEYQTKQDAEKAIEHCHEAFLTWRDTPIEQRAEVIRKLGDLIKDNKNEIAQMMTRQMGKPIEQGKSEIDFCAQICEYTASKGPGFLQDEECELDGGRALITYQPLGVILAMQPWNFPLYQVVRYSVANLLAGNGTALKHAEICWETAQKLQQLYEQAGAPEGLFTLLYVNDETVDELIDHKSVRGVTLTGSAAAGKIVAEKAGAALKKTVLELGGSDPYLVLDDADIDSIVDICVQGRVNNGGQTCIAAKRFIVVESHYEAFKEKFVQAMEQVSYGDPVDSNNQMGPLARADLREKLHDQVKDSIVKGAVCLAGGEIPSGKGYYYPPTVLENVKPGSPAYDDELFGPVAVLMKAKDEKDAIRLANDHRYGLGGGIFSSDEQRAVRVAKQIDTGMVNINGYAIAQPHLPFGGVKESGYGREHGGFGMREFVNIKALMISQ